VVSIRCVEPYDFALSVSAVSAFGRGGSHADGQLRIPAMIGGTPVVVRVSGAGDEAGGLNAASNPDGDAGQVRALVQWVLFADLALQPFYELTGRNPKMVAVVERLHGLKPTRPPSLFETAVTAIIEQQISLASAYHIKDRLIRRFGQAVEDLWVFPTPESLAAASADELRECGLSRQKADYIQSLAGRVVASDVDLDALKSLADEEVRETITRWRGFGP
jgi:DNA-3-methyladenine glycosylase II